jgi:hypothetical protein
VRGGFRADPANADDRVEIPGTHAAHTIFVTEMSSMIGVAGMRTLVDECAPLVRSEGARRAANASS